MAAYDRSLPPPPREYGRGPPAFDRLQRGGPGGYSGPQTAAPVPPMAPAGPPIPTIPPIDREKTCPLLLRVFPAINGHHRLDDYQTRGQEPAGEVQVYTWPDATLRELTDLVKEVKSEARRTTAKFEFAFVYPDRRGRNVLRQVGATHSTRPSDDDLKTLRELNFQTGDFLDVAIF
ncbi:hypothetical protein WJX74_008041 [Apatococcus lobatus]|uniref:Histone deacetylase complex subunit SAP18 n=1 Tax=Apatococcus lobatus TaxID=904363 RepID=A0AAW1R2E4_9CHLO